MNNDGNPIEIEPSAFPVSLSTLEPHQQEVLLHRSNELLSVPQLHSKSSQLGGQEQSAIQEAPSIPEKKTEEDDSIHQKESSEDASCDSQVRSLYILFYSIFILN